MRSGFRPTRLEIDLGAIADNARLLKEIAGSARLMAVVKADGYGHGAECVARTALENGAVALGVATVEEGIALRKAGIAASILVLGAACERAADAAIAHHLEQTVFTTEAVCWLEGAARRRQIPATVHIKADTGMGRIGVRDETAFRALLDAIASSPSIRLAGVFTHFAAADDEDAAFTMAQLEKFLRLAMPLKRRRPELVMHAANSAALLRFPQARLDMARVGLALYAAPALPGVSVPLRQAMRWLTHAVHVKTIMPGETVGYGRRFTADSETRVMTLPVGYADGYHRAVGGSGYALVRGRRAPVIGHVCMDQAMLDVTDIPGAQAGDEVVLLGLQQKECISPSEFGRFCGMIDYEAIVSPTDRVPRVYLPQRSAIDDGRKGG